MAKILIVDDSPTTAGLYKAALEEEGHEIITAGDGEEGLNKIKSEKPDLIIMDVMLPKLDGFHVCRMIKFDEKYKKVPVIMLTAKASDEDKRLGSEVGADDYLVKDEGIEALVELVKKRLK